MPTQTSEAGDPRWRERAVERSLRSARARAVTRSDRFITAAGELLRETGRIDFTVTEIVERSKMSLRSFYQHFAGKDELLLALFEEQIRAYVDRLSEAVNRVEDPVDKLRVFVVGLSGAADGVDRRGSRALTVYHLQLAESHPTDFANALAPQTELLKEIIYQGVVADEFRKDVPIETLTMILMQTVVSAVQTNVLGTHMTGSRVSAEDLWAFCYAGVKAPTPVPAGEPKRRRRGV